MTAVTIRPLREVLVGPVRPALVAVFCGVALLLLIACANVANVALARAEARSRDLAVQAALGASGRRIAGTLVMESLLVGLAGGVAGLLLGAWGVDALIAMAPTELPRLSAVGLDADVLLFTLGAGDDYREFLYGALDRIRALPGVEAAGMVRPLPLGPDTFDGESFGFTIPGRELPANGALLAASLRFVSVEYFQAMGIPLHSGRDFTERDDRPPPDAEPGGAVVIVSRTAAERYWGSDDPVGSRIRVGDAEAEVVGVVGDVRQTALADEPGPVVYVPHRQSSRRGMTIVVRGKEPAALASLLFLCVAACAATIPAVRACRLDPADVIREE